MPKVAIKLIDGTIVGEIELSDDIFAQEYNPFPIQEVVRMQLAKRRRGTHSTKDRGEVSGSTKKLYKQKGTGRARSGSIKSPLRKGGGIIFGPKPRDYSYAIPKKVRQKALTIALSKKLTDGQLEVIREFNLEHPKTKNAIKLIDSKNEFKTTLIIYNDAQENLTKSLRNVKSFKTLHVRGLNVYDLVYFQRIILLEKSINSINERLGK
jgi:large subunit ribosomal protein L4